MKTLKSFKKYGCLNLLALDIYGIEKFRREVETWDEANLARLNEMQDAALARSAVNTEDPGTRRLLRAVERSVQEGLGVLTFAGLDAPFWDMDDEELRAFMERLEELQITGFVYESRDSAAYETFCRLEELGWKIAGLSRRPTEMGLFKIYNGREGELTRRDYVYGIRIKKSKKN